MAEAVETSDTEVVTVELEFEELGRTHVDQTILGAMDRHYLVVPKPAQPVARGEDMAALCIGDCAGAREVDHLRDGLHIHRAEEVVEVVEGVR